MNRLAPPDGLMLVCVLLLVTLSMVLVASASLGISEVRYSDPLRVISHWAVYMPLGLLLMWFLSCIEVTWWQAMALPLLFINLILMILVLIPGIGMEINGARRWFSVSGITLQPVELMKPALILYMAHYMTAFPDRLKRFSSGLAPMLVMLGIAIVLLLLQPDFGNAALLFAVSICLWFVGGVPIAQLLSILGIFIPIGLFIMVAEPYRMKRLLSFIDPWADPLGSGYQLIQSMLAFGAGGLNGAGLGQGVQKLFYLPEPFTDFIAAVLAEELGFIGVMALMLLFMGLLGRGLQVVYSTNEQFSRLLVLGCVLLLGFSFIINMGAVMGILPTKGMPMPIISYGGSALFGSFLLIGFIFSVQRHQPSNRRKGVSA
ncbi:MAG: putative lipid II flippase FtsW [Mariprofundaceae bacterium]